MRRRAFTLIELLVVIGVIAVLIGILLPALSQSRKFGKRAVTLAHLRELGVGMLAYLQDSPEFPTMVVHEEKAFLGLSLLGRGLRVPAKAFVNPNTQDREPHLLTDDGRWVLAELDGTPIEVDTSIAPTDVARIEWHCSYAYDNDPKEAARGKVQVFLGDRADYETGRTFSANWQGDGMCLLWTDGHGEFVRHNHLAEQSDPNIYHHNEYNGEGADEINGGVRVSPGTIDTHLRFFSEEEDDLLLPD